MKACGLIVEYNPFHYGHLYHVNKAREISNADCVIAIMSGSFLQRGEPAIIDKFHRAKAALLNGVDIVIELPYPYAVQSSAYFAKGAVLSLDALGVSSICFGSESGEIEPFTNAVTTLHKNKTLFDRKIRAYLDKGYSFPEANNKAYDTIQLNEINLSQPNNILGFSYVKTIIRNNLAIEPLTIKRIKNDYHEQIITNQIASATSIRNELMKNELSEKISATLPENSLFQLKEYKKQATIWHHWEHYFPYLHYKVITLKPSELIEVHGVDEGLEHRIKQTAIHAHSFSDWINRLKTKRYTQARLQRTFIHILTNTTKKEVIHFTNNNEVPYIRLLGMNQIGQTYLNKQKKKLQVPVYTNLNRKNHSDLALDEKATNVYYAILPAKQRDHLRKQEFSLPLII